ncbi:MAG: Ferrous iron permease EfeU [Chroococcopsis gigantea SAG 12.99]|jgi:high-affinity iron transporter|nr:Ferrous iron permease EfeU [Chroococcopsis gigantea SAG 12.99]
MLDLTAALPSFVVTFREGFEAALVVGIVLACLKKAGRTNLNRWVYQGIGGGIAASIGVGLVLGGLLLKVETSDNLYAPLLKDILATLFGTVAIVMLSWMLVWMTQQAKSLKSEVESAIKSALDSDKAAGKAIFLLVFIAVLREGFETVLFISAGFTAGWQGPTLGAIGGLLAATILGILLFAGGVKINIRLFFQVMGTFLLLIVGGLVMGVLKHLDAAVGGFVELNPAYEFLCISRSSCLLGPQIWDGSGILPERQFPGIILKTLFGYRQTLYSVQIMSYAGFLIGVGLTYFRSFNIPTHKKGVA